MKTATRLTMIAAAMSCTYATPALAQSSTPEQDLAEMRAQLAALSSRIDQLEGELAEAKAANAVQDASIAKQERNIAADAAAKEPDTAVSWKGAPEIEGKGGWSFKPRGRIQVDAGSISRPDGITDASTGFGTEVRRAYLGVEGKMPGNFGYRAEVDLASSDVEITDLYITYSPSKELTLLVGQTKPFWGLEEVTSDLFTSFTERAAFNSAFGFERRLGASASWSKGIVLVQGGIFTDNIADLNNDENNALSYDGRLVVMPKLAGGQFHLGGSAHFRDFNNGANSVRYRARPFIHTPDIRFTDTNSIMADGETGFGLETAYIAGPFHATGEAHWQKVDRTNGTDPTFFGGYAEVGYFLTKDDTRGYKNGVFDRIKPARPLGEGGMGALQLNLRYDYLDLSDADILGGTQNTYGVSLIWLPTAYTRITANYGRIDYSDAAIATAEGNRDYNVDAFGVRAQIDF